MIEIIAGEKGKGKNQRIISQSKSFCCSRIRKYCLSGQKPEAYV